jgi:hypothetical protein
MVASGLVLAATVSVAAGCSSAGSKTSKTSKTTQSANESANQSASKTASHSTTTVAPATTSTSAPSTTTVVAPNPPATTPTPVSPQTAPPDAETKAKQFFAAWLAHDLAGMVSNGDLTARRAAEANYAQTSGATWVFSNCQGAAGSQYCTWVRAAQDVVVRASDVTTPITTVEFQWNALEPADIAEQFVDAWDFGSSAALGALGEAGAVSQATALDAHRSAGWQAPSACVGTAGSYYCTFTAGSSKLNVQVGDVQMPRQVVGVTYTT